MRVDVWDVKPAEPEVSLDCGYAKNFAETFDVVGAPIGKGGFGLVSVVVERATGDEYACKSIKKRLDVPNISAAKQAQHLDNIDREVKILKRLRGTLRYARAPAAAAEPNIPLPISLPNPPPPTIQFSTPID